MKKKKTTTGNKVLDLKLYNRLKLKHTQVIKSSAFYRQLNSENKVDEAN